MHSLRLSIVIPHLNSNFFFNLWCHLETNLLCRFHVSSKSVVVGCVLCKRKELIFFMFLHFENLWLYFNFYCKIYVTPRRQNPITYSYGWLNWHAFSCFWRQLVLSDLGRFLYAPFKEGNIMFWKLIFLFGIQGCMKS